jgi:tryptophan synthase beta chain
VAPQNEIITSVPAYVLSERKFFIAPAKNLLKQLRRIAMSNEKIPYKIYLEEKDLPKQWYNVRADMKKKPAPLLNPATGKPCTAEELSHVFCNELVQQELNETDPYIAIPQEIQDFYKMFRPSPLIRAYFLEKKLGTPAKI